MRHDPHRVSVLFAEKGDGARLLGLGDGKHVGVGGGVVADALVHQVLDPLLLRVAEGGAVGEVEAQAIGGHQRAFLRDVGAERVPERPVQEVRGRVVATNVVAALGVDGELDRVAHAQLARFDLAEVDPQRGDRAAAIAHAPSSPCPETSVPASPTWPPCSP